MKIPATWQAVLAEETSQPYYAELCEFVAKERAEHTIFPPEEDVFSALALTPYEHVRVLILGQDPYHGPGQAHGLCFSVQPKVKLPPSLKNIFKELASDLGEEISTDGCLTRWAEQGVLLINAVMTVRQGAANSHKKKGWEQFTDAIIRKVNEKPDPVAFILWGAYAQKKTDLINTDRHRIFASAHPSPLSARNGFFGSRPFSQVNAWLEENKQAPVKW